uniref:Nucleoprotein n=1 Tax=Bat coronavirus HKU9 TaxID=694006 RepID=A0A2P1M5J9_BCHK9|nr:N protein [Rousettus bat coronavirus HKU9]AVP25410.1 nucleocapsid phosphoprotein [Rousettus bat coronavirus HKU9]
MSGRNKPRPSNQAKVTFKQESDNSDSESERRNGNRSGARPKNNNNRGANPKPEKPKAAPPQNVSWFAPLVQTGKQDLRFPRGEGVPISQGVDLNYLHGYWVRTQRSYQKGGKTVQANARWYFYYTGTGRFGDLRWGQKNPEIIWVGEEGANVNRVGDMGTRNPNNDAAIPVQLSGGIPKGFYAEGRNSRGNSRNGSRNSSRASSRGSSRASSRGASPGRNTPSGGSNSEPWMAYLVQKLEALETKVNGNKSETKTPVQVSKNAAAENAKRLRHKRTPHKGSGVTVNYGRRGPGDWEGNLGDQTILKLGTDDPRFPVAAQMAPNVASFLFMSHFSTRDEDEALWLQYKGAIKLPKADPNYEQWVKFLDENLNAYKNFPPPEPKKDKKKKEEVSQEIIVHEDASTGTDQPIVKVWVKDEGAQTDDEWLGGDDTVYEEEEDKPKVQRRHKKRGSTASRVTVADPTNVAAERS